jgi:hypothetical protein
VKRKMEGQDKKIYIGLYGWIKTDTNGWVNGRIDVQTDIV